jgi:hypothetical protein
VIRVARSGLCAFFPAFFFLLISLVSFPSSFNQVGLALVNFGDFFDFFATSLSYHNFIFLFSIRVDWSLSFPALIRI